MKQQKGNDLDYLKRHGFVMSLATKVDVILSIEDRDGILDKEIEKNIQQNPDLKVGRKHIFDTGTMFVQLTLNRRRKLLGLFNCRYDRVEGEVAI